MPTRLRLAAALLLSLAFVLPARAADKPAAIAVDKDAKTVTVTGTIAPRKLPKFDRVYPIEVVATFPAPKGQKALETILTYDAKPSEIHKALETLGLKAGKPVQGEGKPTGPEVDLFLEYPGADGKAKKVPLAETFVVIKTGKPLEGVKWLFTGSDFKFPDPEKDDKAYGADLTGTLATIYPVTNDTVFQTNLTLKDEKDVKLEVSKDLPKEGTAVKLVIQVKK
jgi:hypothetical protein